MKTHRLDVLKTKLPDKQAFSIETEPNDLRLHQLCILTAKRGGGKTVSVSNLLRHYKDRGYFDRVYLITPTYGSNKQIWDIARIEEEDVIDISETAIDQIIARVAKEKRDWDDFLRQKEIYNDRGSDRLRFVSDDDLLRWSDCGLFSGKKPKWKYRNEVPPRLALVVDDALNSPVMSSKRSGLINLCLRHRHLSCIGISIYMLVQSYVAQGGVPRVIREHCTSLLIFKTSDERILQRLYEELDLELSFDRFMDMMHYAHEKPYNYLLIDFSPKEPRLRFRSGYNEAIEP
eukprot:6212438-Pleurochrysis_carterae.AAC.2